MGDIENNIENEIKVENEEFGTKKTTNFTRLDEEIKVEENSRKVQKDNIANFKKSQKPKKSLKRRILAWGLGVAIFAGSALGIGLAINGSNGDNAYNREVESKFEFVDQKLTTKLSKNANYSQYKNKKITHLEFDDSNGSVDETKLLVYFEGELKRPHGYEKTQTIAYFNVLYDYYSKLVNAEERNNMLDYLDCLGQIFDNMTYEKHKRQQKVGFFNFDTVLPNKEENFEKVNELFKLDIEKEGVVRQIGFLPYNIEVVSYEDDNETKTTHYTYKLSGISYCETVEKNNDEVPVGADDLLIVNNYNKNKVKTFYRDIIFTSSRSFEDGRTEKIDCLWGDLNMFLLGIKTDPIEIKTTYFNETHLFEDYMTMSKGAFNFEKPENLK